MVGPKRQFNQTKYLLATVIATAAFFLLWHLIALKLGKPIILPTPAAVLAQIGQWLTAWEFYTAVLATLLRILICFALSLVLALILGVAAGLFWPAKAALLPLVALSRSVPTLAIIILILIWCSADLTPIVVGCIMVFPLFYDAVIAAILSTDRQLLELGQAFKLSRLNVLRHIYLPQIKNRLIAGSAAAIGLAAKVVVAGEVLGQPNLGIGNSIQMAKITFDTAGVIAWVLVVAVLMLLCEKAIRYWAKRQAGGGRC